MQHLRITRLQDYNSCDGVTINTLYELLKQEDKQNERKESYVSSQDCNYNRHINEYFAIAKIDKLTYEDLKKWRETLVVKEIANKTINKIVIIMKKMLPIAVKKGFI